MLHSDDSILLVGIIHIHLIKYKNEYNIQIHVNALSNSNAKSLSIHPSFLPPPLTLSPLNQEWIGDQAAINLIKLP